MIACLVICSNSHPNAILKKTIPLKKTKVNYFKVNLIIYTTKDLTKDFILQFYKHQPASRLSVDSVLNSYELNNKKKTEYFKN